MFNRNHVLVMSIILVLLCITAVCAEDFCEFSDVKSVSSYGWNTEAVNGKPLLEVSTDAKVGKYALIASGRDFMGDWGTLALFKDINLTGAKKGDEISFYVKQNFTSGLYLNISGVYIDFPVTSGEWTKVTLDLDPEKWSWDGRAKEWGRLSKFAFYSRTFTSSGQYLMLDGLSFRINGKYIPANIPMEISNTSEPVINEKKAIINTNSSLRAENIPSLNSHKTPSKDSEFYIMKDENGVWAISKKTGSVAGGWSMNSHERCLVSLESSYFVENTKDLWKALERNDKIENSKISTSGKEAAFTCSNTDIPDIRISKVYKLTKDGLVRKITFYSNSKEKLFISMRSEAVLDKEFRQNGAYVGAGSVGPIELASLIQEEKQPLHYTNSRGMILSNPHKEYSFAHYRSKLQDDFVFPWWSFSRAESAKDCFYYTPSGWKLPMGILGLPINTSVSYEDNLIIFPGDYYDFVTKIYPARNDVKKKLSAIGNTPSWLQNVKVSTISYTSDTNRIERLAQTTDDGDILVMTGVVGLNWADYYVDKGLIGAWGGWITGPELKEWVQKIKTISPRVKVGIYCYMDATFYNSRIYKAHPEWFRAKDKDGNTVNHFQGSADNYTTMLGIDECRKTIISQYDLILSYLPVDVVYLDDGLTNNLVNWQTGDVLRDSDCEALFKGIREITKKYGKDKATFFNGQGNPYGDINFIEAYSRLSADNWRTFAGVGLGAETFLVNRPGERIIPLYWTKDLGREYINRVLALGWIPSLEYTDEVETRAFTTAAYEIGNVNPIKAVYSPDWRNDISCKIESYTVRRLGDYGNILSFISHENSDVKQTIKIDTRSLKLDRKKDLYVWAYEIQDATKFKGIAGENSAKDIYRKSGWTLDYVTTPKWIYSGKPEKMLTVDVNLKPLILNMVYVSNVAAGVYSENGLPSQFMFANTKGVKLQSTEHQGLLTVMAESTAKTSEVIIFSRSQIAKVTMDGKAIQPKWVCLDGKLMPVVKISSGHHKINVLYSVKKPEVSNFDNISVSANDGFIEISLSETQTRISSCLITIKKNGLYFLNSVVKCDNGICRVPIPSQGGGIYEIEVCGIYRNGVMIPVQAEPVNVELPAIAVKANLTPSEPPSMPLKKDIIEVNKTVGGIEILSTGTEITATPQTVFQPNLMPLMAEVTLDNLTIEAGTTRKIEGFMGAAFGGFEIKNLQSVGLRLGNTFFEAYNCTGIGDPYHPYHPSSRSFAGFIVDYHTPAGYTKRVALGVGVMHPDLSTPFPSYGKGTKPDQMIDLGPIVKEGKGKEFIIDLLSYAPDNWDGQVWFSAGTDWVAADRRLKVQILSANKPIADSAIKGIDPADFQKIFRAKRKLEIPKISSPVAIDGKLDELSWQNAAETSEFFLVGGKGYPGMKTSARVMYDDTNIYVALICEETARKKPLFGKGNIWYDDEVEVYINPDAKDYKQIMVNAGGSKAEFFNGHEGIIGASASSTINEGQSWTVEIAFPFKALGKVPSIGDVWRMNLARYRPEGAGFTAELITWSPTQNGFGSGELDKFGELVFK